MTFSSYSTPYLLHLFSPPTYKNFPRAASTAGFPRETIPNTGFMFLISYMRKLSLNISILLPCCYEASNNINLVSIHSSASYQQNTSANYKDCTNDVENSCTHTTCFWESCTSLVKNFNCCYNCIFNT